MKELVIRCPCRYGNEVVFDEDDASHVYSHTFAPLRLDEVFPLWPLVPTTMVCMGCRNVVSLEVREHEE